MLLGAGEIITKSWKTFVEHWKDLTKFLLYIWVLYIVTFALIGFGVYVSFITGSLIALILLILLGVIVAIIGGVILQSALTKSVGELLKNNKMMDFKSAVQFSKPLFWPVLLTGLLTAAIILGGYVLLIVPGIIFAVWYMFGTYAVIFEGKKYMTALNFSKSLVSGRWWGMVWRVVAPSFVFSVIIQIVQKILLIPVGSNPSSVIGVIYAAIIQGGASVLITALTTIAIVMLYFSAKENAPTMNMSK
jgi:hypothetical protein